MCCAENVIPADYIWRKRSNGPYGTLWTRKDAFLPYYYNEQIGLHTMRKVGTGLGQFEVTVSCYTTA